MELFARASTLEEARRALLLDYTYQITGDPNKRAARKMLGTMTAEILETMTDELVRAGIQSWTEHERLGGSPTGTDQVHSASDA